MDGRGIKYLHKCGEEMSKNSSLPSQEQQETSEVNGSGGGRGKGIRGPRSFVPVGDTNRDKRGVFYPGWWLQPGQMTHVLPAGPASRWTRDKSHILSRAQRQPGQMAWNKALFCRTVDISMYACAVPGQPASLSRVPMWGPRFAGHARLHGAVYCG